MFRSLLNIVGFIFLSSAILTARSQTSFDIHNGDTINVIDENNLKQGKWIYFGKDKNNPEFKPDQIVEEGTYQNSRKDGLWIKYYPNGNVHSKIQYSRNRPSGEYEVYYKNGQLQEKGNWKHNRNVGEFKRFYKNGNVQQEFNFNKTGKREGVQKYYHENGQLQIVGEWDGGKESGVVKEYYANGDLKSEKYFADGKMDKTKSKAYQPQKPVAEVKEEPEVEEKVAPKVSKEEKPNLGVFDGNGQYTLYNKDRQVSQKGEFKNGKLINGIRYKYDENGILEAKERYKNGRYVGNVPIEKDD